MIELPIWQDIVFFAGGFILAVVLYPTVTNPEASLPWKTSVPTATILYAFSFTYVTLDLYLAAVMNFFAAFMWTMIVLFRRPGDSDE